MLKSIKRFMKICHWLHQGIDETVEKEGAVMNGMEM